MRVTLTFDNGPTPGVTEQVVEVLARHDVPARFFAVGEKLATPAGRAAAARVVAAGHVVGGHTWSHSVPFGELDPGAVDRELDDTRRAVDDVGGDGAAYRPYGVGGHIDERLMSGHGAQRLRDGGFTCVLWNSVPGHCRDPVGSCAVALTDLGSRDWSVVVLHDLPDGAPARLDEFLRGAADLGAEFTTATPDECTPIRNGRPTTSYGLLGVGAAGRC